MTVRSASRLTFLVAVTMVGCEGPRGPAGSTGLPGDAGSNGHTALVATSAEPAGANCVAGGTKIDVGIDANDDGTLQASEVTVGATRYICTGSAVATTTEPPGAHCVNGGQKIEVGADANGNGLLETSEVNAALTTYVCNGLSGMSSGSTGLHVTYTDVTKAAGAPITVTFKLTDDRGYPVNMAGVYSVNTVIVPRFALAYTEVDAAGNVLPYVVLTKAGSSSAPTVLQPTTYTPTSPGSGTLVEVGHGAGTYTYTFPTTSTTGGNVAVAYDATKLNNTHVIWMQIARQTDLVEITRPETFTAVNEPDWYVPSGSGTPVVREVVKSENCYSCHRGFKAEGTTATAFHGGGRMDPKFCGICHNPGRTSNPAAAANVFIHRIHNSEELQTANIFHGIEVPFPQDIRNCATCHKSAAQGGQAQGRPTAAACGSCHDQVSFAGTALVTCTDPPTRDAAGLRVPCNHVGGIRTTDTDCATCHSPALLAGNHAPVQPPDPDNSLIGGSNANTNASYLAAVGFVPTGAAAISYDVSKVQLVADAAITPSKRPQIVFKLESGGTDVVFPTFAAGVTTEIMPNFVGSPSIYFAWAEPQDGITAPADFNVTANGYLKSIWNGTATGAGAGTLTGPDATGYYTLTLTGVSVPPSAVMVTGGVGYSYSLSSTPPLVQTNVAGYPYVAATKQGGLSVPAANVWKVATGFTARRPIVENARCQNCHVTLGIKPTFHAGQRNDGPTCSFCHTGNKTSSGWGAGSRYFIHAIHAGRKRTVAFNWHASSQTETFDDIEFPGAINDCSACHLADTFSYKATASASAVPNLLMQTVAAGRFKNSPILNPTGYFAISPYVAGDNQTDYGAIYSTTNVTQTLPDGNSGTQGGTTCTFAAPCVCTAANPCTVTSTVGKQGAVTCSAGTPCTCTSAATCTITLKTCSNLAPCEADPTTLVSSPIATPCAGCHDSTQAISHMKANGGRFYDTRANALAPGAAPEQCMLCHGPGKVAAIADVHK